jgi:hypothetical protein
VPSGSGLGGRTRARAAGRGVRRWGRGRRCFGDCGNPLGRLGGRLGGGLRPGRAWKEDGCLCGAGAPEPSPNIGAGCAAGSGCGAGRSSAKVG